ncbi:bifunctional phosphoribosyl-AMP cyclohydrolase/phosphoribosyl-ATP diphosphatase HisIE [Nannocystis sp. RBIL2]|uniref:bifunctional phosphoribosyl-AMP cyclohydrolase/phosphoribosyl-ATP diphosphatase HisIE n=1 Tax=Nannocystis sp. RBIL2 TaxID=2996788 RepID=UPI0022713531|nr:bifunctional phosphoribosyl-AMP cyclohydrolase/phosphoribosyl-ATP diphosphatase HisIE [Nannocystis sp. RBIL2]MCY1072403.1 bifunctional phosphoribosyl-AMP cyclohydrolase/phosphoribosyl-ATP diphosphatase HisIE [Nannocystis sp. RBIL2]
MSLQTDPAALWSTLTPGPDGLVAAVVQHVDTGEVLMLGHMNAEALARTLARGRVTFWSRSRQQLWEKGETSGHTLELRGLAVDCDADALLVQAAPRGPTCHTGAPSCFFRPVGEPPAPRPTEVFEQLFAEICERKAGRGMTNRDGKSYVRDLLAGGVAKIAAKLHEEAGELAEALAEDDRGHIAREAADLLFHALVGLAHRDVPLADVAAELARRMGRSGLDEKAARAPAAAEPDGPAPSG